MISRRIYVNLFAFFALFLVLCTWAATKVVSIDAVERPFDVTAYFDEAPGLRANVEVTYLGVRVGQVHAVALGASSAEVSLALRRGTNLPVGVSASVRRKSAAGEPYVALTAPSGWKPGDGYLPDDGSYVIDRAHTTSPLSYGELFSSVDQLLSAVNPDDLGTVVGELSTALAGRGDELRTIFGRGADLTTTLAAHADELDQLATQLTALTGTIADKSSTIAESTDDLGVLVSALAASKADINALLDQAPRLGAQVNDLLAASSDDLRCGISAAAGVSSVVAKPTSLSQLVRLLYAAETARVVLPKATIQGPDGPYLAGTFGFAPGSPASSYDNFIELPQPPPIGECPHQGIDSGDSVGDSPSGGGTAGTSTPNGDDSLAAPAREARPGPASSGAEARHHDFPFGRVLAGLGALLAAAVAGSTKPWRRLTAVPPAPGPTATDTPIDLEGSNHDRS